MSVDPEGIRDDSRTMELHAASIVIVDDDPGAIRLVAEALYQYADVRFATNGTDALRIVAERPPDLVLLDSEMPGLDGFEVCSRLKANPALQDIPVIFVTSYDDLEFETRALSIGAADFIPKPISPLRIQLRVKLHLELKKQRDRLRALASTDGLTQLANRRTFDETLARELRVAARSGEPLSLILVDVDFFKLFNDTYGHPEGDACLKAVASALSTVMRRPTDLAGRIGGEEFAIILPATPLEGALTVARRVQEAVATADVPHRGSSVSERVTVSLGVCCGDPAHDGDAIAEERRDPGVIVRACDEALYAAKRNGRNRIEHVSIPLFAQADAPR